MYSMIGQSIRMLVIACVISFACWWTQQSVGSSIENPQEVRMVSELGEASGGEGR